MRLTQQLLRRGPTPKPRAKVAEPKTPFSWRKTMQRYRPEEMRRWTVPDTPFFQGQKKVYLPSFDITLQRNPLLPPSLAQFVVPLSFNKLDLRDYLWNVYRVKVHSVRSWVIQSPVKAVERFTDRDVPGKKKFYRPKSTKKMIVRLDRPFVWPNLEGVEEDLEAREERLSDEFSNKEHKDEMDELDRQLHLTKLSASGRENAARSIRNDQLHLRADALLSGKLRWKDGRVEAVQAKDEVRIAHENAAAEKTSNYNLEHLARVQARALLLKSHGVPIMENRKRGRKLEKTV